MTCVTGIGKVRRMVAILAVSAGVSGIPASFAAAETLSDVLAYTYRTNPELNAARANLRVIDQGVARAKGGWRPTVTSTLEISREFTDTRNNAASARGSNTPKSASVTVTQPLYRGGRTTADINQAEFSVQQERARLFSAEQQILLSALTVYMDVLRDQSVLELREKNLERLQTQLQATRDRFEVGEVTRTDVAQAEARVARADADLIQAQGDLVISRVAFERVVGFVPGALEQPDVTIFPPESRDSAVEQSVTGNFDLVGAKFDEQRLLQVVDLVTGELLPSLALVTTFGHTADSTLNDDRTTEFNITARLSIPIYQGGQVTARVRGAKEDANRSRIAVEAIRRQTVDLAASSYESWQTSLAQIKALEAGVVAAEIAFEGVEQEATVGARTVLDVLDAEQELLDAQVDLVAANRNEIVAAYQLLSAVGRLTVADLELDVELYDYDTHYREASDLWWGINPVGEQP